MNIKGWVRANFKELLAVYFLYVILFNLVIPQSSLVSDGGGVELQGAVRLFVKGMTYTGSLNCWNSTRESVNGPYLMCSFAISRKALISRGIVVKFSSTSSEPFRIEAVREDLIVNVPPNFTDTAKLEITIRTYDVWWVGIVVPHSIRVVLALNCTGTECELSRIARR
ncbi:hypothetical protein [Thermococcus thioreducens]|uniref:Uncharacterized protein n=1 Tax=Thermococcus thioreducens TaxID=277988 RepID=A0A0Q2UQJ9_9EURY|nr:hypothetical protein [Thermococcus thioreducens]ASJ12203.1 hypothetical protein A3L14_04570 [Thermococcus thioreducens]KQH82944.1 hypothetical protein AMR53_01565 [Thermococcus thioreducens]SEV94973.1 hypothetical protein SAMN05216170_1053 [Thermococcus thioreducens]